MGYLYLAIKIPQVLTMAFFNNIASHLRFLMLIALTHLGLYKSPPPIHHDFRSDSTAATAAANYVLILDGSSPSLVPIPVHLVTASIKKKIAVLPYGDFSDRFAGDVIDDVCTVCLDCIDRSHPIRVLLNCKHVFHRECLDTWVDDGQVTCPLCRSMLLPPKMFFSSAAAAVDSDFPVSNSLGDNGD